MGHELHYRELTREQKLARRVGTARRDSNGNLLPGEYNGRGQPLDGRTKDYQPTNFEDFFTKGTGFKRLQDAARGNASNADIAHGEDATTVGPEDRRTPVAPYPGNRNRSATGPGGGVPQPGMPSRGPAASPQDGAGDDGEGADGPVGAPGELGVAGSNEPEEPNTTPAPARQAGARRTAATGGTETLMPSASGPRWVASVAPGTAPAINNPRGGEAATASLARTAQRVNMPVPVGRPLTFNTATDDRNQKQDFQANLDWYRNNVAVRAEAVPTARPDRLADVNGEGVQGLLDAAAGIKRQDANTTAPADVIAAAGRNRSVEAVGADGKSYGTVSSRKSDTRAGLLPASQITDDSVSDEGIGGVQANVGVGRMTPAAMRADLYQRHPKIFEAGTPENAAYVAQTRAHPNGEAGAYQDVDNIIANIPPEPKPQTRPVAGVNVSPATAHDDMNAGGTTPPPNYPAPRIVTGPGSGSGSVLPPSPKKTAGELLGIPAAPAANDGLSQAEGFIKSETVPKSAAGALSSGPAPMAGAPAAPQAAAKGISPNPGASPGAPDGSPPLADANTTMPLQKGTWGDALAAAKPDDEDKKGQLADSGTPWSFDLSA